MKPRTILCSDLGHLVEGIDCTCVDHSGAGDEGHGQDTFGPISFQGLTESAETHTLSCINRNAHDAAPSDTKETRSTDNDVVHFTAGVHALPRLRRQPIARRVVADAFECSLASCPQANEIGHRSPADQDTLQVEGEASQRRATHSRQLKDWIM